MNQPTFKIVINSPDRREGNLFEERALATVREMRLHHYETAVKVSSWIRNWEGRSRPGTRVVEDKIRLLKKTHAFHMGRVQFLNDFFAVGDTAEGDAAK